MTPTKKNGRAKRIGGTQKFHLGDEHEVDAIACAMHNLAATCVGNTQDSDVEWFGKWLYNASNFGLGYCRRFAWSLSNEEFDAVNLLPDRIWTGYRWETMPDQFKEAWYKLARLCMYAMPRIAERIGHRMLAQSKVLRAQRAAVVKAAKAMNNSEN